MTRRPKPSTSTGTIQITEAGTIYRCSNCGKRYCRPGGIQMSCCVLHGPKDCCHAFELPVTKKGWIKRERVPV